MTPKLSHMVQLHDIDQLSTEDLILACAIVSKANEESSLHNLCAFFLF